MPALECFFDVSSPWTYLGFEGLIPIAKSHQVEVTWRPILVGGIFNTINPSVYHSRDYPVAAKQSYLAKDLHDWAEHADLAIRFPPSVFPVNSVKAMRACLVAAERGALEPYARAAFRRYWGNDEDISTDAVLAAIATDVGFDADELNDEIQRTDIKDALRRNTEELVERGGFGSPTFFIDTTDMYFGQDRLVLVERALARRTQG